MCDRKNMKKKFPLYHPSFMVRWWVLVHSWPFGGVLVDSGSLWTFKQTLVLLS
jgi:hypothetical protein